MATTVARENLIVFDPTVTTVQELAKKSLPTLPKSYVHEPDEKPLPEAQLLPIIDMNNFLSEQHREAELQKLHTACKEWGIFQMVNHGVSEEELAKVNKEVERFFHLPTEEKMKYKIRPGDIEGYGSVIRSEAEKQDWCDRFFMTINPVHKRKPYLLPQFPPSLRDVLDNFYIGKTQGLAMTLLGLLEKALKLEENELKDMCEDGFQSMRMAYYPECPKPEQAMGLKAHSDYTVITILNQVNGVSGLQVEKDGEWIPVEILPNALVVNVGDVLQIISNGLYRSPVHRAAVNTEKERISLIVFFLPNLDAEFGPSKSLISPENPPRYETISMEEFSNNYFSLKEKGRSL